MMPPTRSPLRAASVWLVLAVGAIALTTRLAIADGAPPPPPPQTCATDADCPGCQRCAGGVCPGVEVQADVCMCNAECERIGMASCDLSVDKPLCGGRCVAVPKSRELTCGAGDDLVKLEPFVTPITETTGAKQAADALVIEQPTVNGR
jgi:hypothetical protein